MAFGKLIKEASELVIEGCVCVSKCISRFSLSDSTMLASGKHKWKTNDKMTNHS